MNTVIPNLSLSLNSIEKSLVRQSAVCENIKPRKTHDFLDLLPHHSVQAFAGDLCDPITAPLQRGFVIKPPKHSLQYLTDEFRQPVLVWWGLLVLGPTLLYLHHDSGPLGQRSCLGAASIDMCFSVACTTFCMPGTLFLWLLKA